MSRIGRMPISIPAGVDVKIEEGNRIATLSCVPHDEEEVSQDVTVEDDGTGDEE